jgi:DNA-binding beta-propeller fold protein YncE
MAPDDSGQGGPRSGQQVRHRLRPGWSTLLAIAALGCGMTALAGGIALSAGRLWPYGLLAGILAVVLGAIAFPLVKARGRPGRRLAIAGLVTGALGVLLNVVVIGIALYGALVAEGRIAPPVSAMAFSPDGTRVVSVPSSGDRIHLSDVASGRVIATWTYRSYVVVAFSPDGRTLAAGGGAGDGRIYLRDVASGRVIETLADTGGTGASGLEELAFSPDGRTLAVGGVDARIYLRDVSTGRKVAILTVPGTDSIVRLAFSPDGTLVAGTATSGSTYLWQVASGREIATLAGPARGGVIGLAFSPDGTTLVVGDTDGSTYRSKVG